MFVQVKQREDDTQCSKMMLRFREDKIKRLESLSAGFLTAELYLMQEKNTLVEELQLLQAKIDRNPELTRFAMENIRLLEQLRRFANNLLPMAFNFTLYVLLSRNRMHRNLHRSLYLHKWLSMAFDVSLTRDPFCAGSRIFTQVERGKPWLTRYPT